MRHPALCSALLLLCLPQPLEAGQYQLRRVAENILVAVRTPLLEYPVQGNVTLLINDRDVVVIDSPRTPDSASQVVELIRSVTEKPVRYLINTHWHGDHHHGNAVFAEAFPGLEIIGNEHLREEILTLGRRSLDGQIAQFRNRDALRDRLEKGVDGDGVPLTAAESHRLRQLLSIPEGFAEQLEAVKLTPPTLTYRHTLELQRGSRRIRIQTPGAGNTRGDATIYLPEEKVLISGDLLVETVPFMSLSYPYSWLERLEEIAALDFEVIIPGHGEPMRDRLWLQRHIRLLRSLTTQIESCLDRRLDLPACHRHVDLDAFRREYSGGDPSLQNEFDYRVSGPAVRDGFREGKQRRYGLDSADYERLRQQSRQLFGPALLPAVPGSSEGLQQDLQAWPEVEEWIGSRRWQLALARLQEIATSSAGSRLAGRAEEENADLAVLERWHREAGPEGVASPRMELPGCSPRFLCGLAQDSANRGRHYSQAAVQHGRVAGIPAGAYYAGLGEAFNAFSRWLDGLALHSPSASPLRWNSAAGLQELEARGQRLFKEMPDNRQAVEANAVVREVRELAARGWRAGALLRALEAVRLLEAGRSGAASEFDLPDLTAKFNRVADRILSAGSDHSIAEYYLLLAREDLEDAPVRPGRIRGQVAAAVLDSVLPFYFQFLEDDELN